MFPFAVNIFARSGLCRPGGSCVPQLLASRVFAVRLVKCWAVAWTSGSTAVWFTHVVRCYSTSRICRCSRRPCAPDHPPRHSHHAQVSHSTCRCSRRPCATSHTPHPVRHPVSFCCCLYCCCCSVAATSCSRTM